MLWTTQWHEDTPQRAALSRDIEMHVLADMADEVSALIQIRAVRSRLLSASHGVRIAHWTRSPTAKVT